MSAKDQYHRDFLNSLRERLNVDDKTIANLEKRITGKCPSLSEWWPEIYPWAFRWGALRSAGAIEIACRVCRQLFGKIGFSREGVSKDALAAQMTTTGKFRPKLTFKNYNI